MFGTSMLYSRMILIVLIFHFARRDTVFLNRCVKNETMESITSLITKLGLDNFYKVCKFPF